MRFEFFRKPWDWEDEYTSTITTNPDIVDKLANSLTRPGYVDIPSSRSPWKRFVDVLSLPNYALAGAIKGMIDDDERGSVTPWEGFTGGLAAGNPFGKGYNKGEVTFSNVLESAGWKPTSTAGKIGKGLTGFALDVMLDPTTYLSGGASALIKGTGKAAGKKMTTEAARELIIKKAITDEKTLTSYDMTTGAEKLAELFNKTMGTDRKATDLTLKLGNAPFGNKIFGSNASKGFKVASGEGIAKLGDYTLAPVYNKLRSSIYGSKIGEMFSTVTPLYKLGKTKPHELYNFVKFTEMTKGLTKDKVSAEKLIRDKARELELTEADTKQVLDLMEDKTVWSKVSQIVKFTDTKEAENITADLRNKEATESKKLKDLEEKRQHLEVLKHANDNKLIDANKELEELREEYQVNLREIKSSFLSTSEEKEAFMKLMDDELKTLDNEIAVGKEIGDEGKVVDPEVENIIKLHDELTEQQKVFEDGIKQREALKGMKVKDPEATDEWRQKNNIDKDNLDLIQDQTKVINNAVEEELIKLTEELDNIKGNDELVEAISQHIYGNKTSISKNIYKPNIDELLKMIKKGDSKDDIERYINKNANLYTGRTKTINDFMADYFQYGKGKKGKDGFADWNEFYTERMKKLEGKKANKVELKRQIKELSRNQQIVGKKEFYEKRIEELEKQLSQAKMDDELYVFLKKANYDRRILYAKFNKAKTVDELREVIRQQRHALGMKDYNDSLIGELERRKELFNDHDYAMVDEKRDKDMRFKDQMVNQRYDTTLNIDELEDIKDKIKDKIFKNIKGDVNIQTVRWIDSVIEEVNPLLKDFFKKGYNDLTDKQKDFLLSKSIAHAYKRSRGEKVVTFTDEDILRLKVKKEAKQMKVEREKKYGELEKSLDIDSEVSVKYDNRPGWGKVVGVKEKDGIKSYNIQRLYGSIVEDVPISRILGKQEKVKGSIEDAVIKSEVAKETIERKEELVRLIEETKSTLSKEKREYVETANKMRNGILQSADEVQKRIMKLEKEKIMLDDAMLNGDTKNIAEIAGKLDVYRKALESDDAFDTYARMKLGEAGYNKAIKNVEDELPIKYVLDDRLDIDDSVKEVVKFLRKSMDDIGKSEVKMGKLKKEQFDSMVGRYIYHMLTPEGLKYFTENKLIDEKVSGLTQDLGFGNAFSPHILSRKFKKIKIGDEWIENPTIRQLNEYLAPELNGANAFSENIADIYLARMLKHEELKYDNEYMHSMMETFGHKVEYGEVVEEGFKPVMNVGKMREFTNNMAKYGLSMRISDELEEYIRPHFMSARESALAYFRSTGEKFDIRVYKDLVNQHIERKLQSFVDENLTDDLLKKKYDEELKYTMDGVGLGDLSKKNEIPMLELVQGQHESFIDFHKNTRHKYLTKIKNRIYNYEKGKQYDLNINPKNGDTYQLTEKQEKLLKKRSEVISKASEEELREILKQHMKNEGEHGIKRLNTINESIDKLNEIIPPQVRGVSEAIVNKANQTRKIQIAKDENSYLQMYDKFTHLIKLMQTVVAPAFHLRNKYSNMFNNYLEIGQDAVNKEYQINAFKTLKNKGRTGTNDTVMIQGREVKWDELYDLAAQHKAVDEGFYAADIGAGASMSGVFKGKVNPKYDPTDTRNFALYKWGTEAGSLIENSDRFIHFVSQLKRGLSPEQAAESVNRFLFDYSDLTAFEQNVMKRIFPYYTWMRKNAALQAEMIIDRPEKYRMVAKMLNGIEGMNNEEDKIDERFSNDFARDWVQTPFSVTNPDGFKERVLLNPNMPFMDLSRIGSLRNITSMVNPLAKVPAEMLTNNNIFFDQPIARESDNISGQYADHALSQAALYNIGKDLINKSGVDLALSIGNNITGVKALSYDYDKYKYMKIKEYASKMHEKGVMDEIIDVLSKKVEESDKLEKKYKIEYDETEPKGDVNNDDLKYLWED